MNNNVMNFPSRWIPEHSARMNCLKHDSTCFRVVRFRLCFHVCFVFVYVLSPPLSCDWLFPLCVIFVISCSVLPLLISLSINTLVFLYYVVKYWASVFCCLGHTKPLFCVCFLGFLTSYSFSVSLFCYVQCSLFADHLTNACLLILILSFVLDLSACLLINPLTAIASVIILNYLHYVTHNSIIKRI